MKLRHYSHQIVTKVQGRRQIDLHSGKDRLFGKPQGFWVSDETRGAHGWKAWCRSERFRPDGLRYEHEVTLSPKARILYLRSVEDIDKFTAEYGYDMLADLNSKLDKPFVRNYTRMDAVDWKRLSKKYHGIIITPYQWARRLDGVASWYYTWDCASGCIWNPNAIESIKMVREYKAPRHLTRREELRKRRRSMVKMAEVSKELVASLGRRNSPIDDALIKSADEIISKYGGK